MNYNFTDMNQVGAMRMISESQLIYDGINIDDTLTDVQCTVMTLNITGRGAVDYNLNTVSPDMRDGEMFRDISLKPRTLQVELLISASDNATLRMKYEQLNKLLRRKEVVPISFTDEVDRLYFGIYTGSDNPKEDSNEQILTIEVYCPDPFKYTELKSIVYQNSSVLNIDTDFPTRPYIGIAYSGSSTTLDVLNTTTGKGFKLSGLNPAVEKIYRIDLLQEMLTKSDLYENAFKNLSIDSDWEDFSIKPGDQIVVTPAPSSITMRYRGVHL